VQDTPRSEILKLASEQLNEVPVTVNPLSQNALPEGFTISSPKEITGVLTRIILMLRTYKKTEKQIRITLLHTGMQWYVSV